MKNTSRRQMLRSSAAIGAGIMSGSALNPGSATAAEKTCPGNDCMHGSNTGQGPQLTPRPNSDFGHKILFMDEYHKGTMELLGRLSGETGHIGELSSRAVSVINNGGTVWTSMNIGHMPSHEQKETRRGGPGIMKDHSDFESLKKGDILFTNQCSKDVLAARERGVYVVSVTVNYTDNEFRPVGFANLNEDGLMLADVSNEILHSHVPYYQGLVHAPEIPEMTLCPSTTTGLGAVHWMLNAEIANKLADNKAKEVDKSAEYLRILTERVKMLTQYRGKIMETALAMTERIVDGGRWFVRSIEHPGLESELHGVASGPMIVNWGDWDAKKDKNVMLINAISPSHPDEVKLAMEKQLEGAYVIGVGPCSVDGVVPPGRLIDIADSGFSNLSPESGGVIKINKRDGTICPTSGIIGNIIQQMICAQWTDEMLRTGHTPYYWMGFFQNGGRPYDDGIRMFFERQGF
ncbi:hypothetical protein ACFL6P_00895 [Candidatus Latescibacterota bacterium]